MKGVVVKFDDARGFGFIRSKAFSEDAFVHIKAVKDRQTLKIGQKVEFEIKHTQKGLAAINVIPGKQQMGLALFCSLIAFGSVIVLLGIMLIYGINGLIAYFISVNIVTFVVYGYDKSISKSSQSKPNKSKSTLLRIPENVLHLLALAGGSPGALIGQKLFRHKTIKRSFQIFYWMIVVLQILLLIYFLS